MFETWLTYFAVTVAIELPLIALLVGRPRAVHARFASRRAAREAAASAQHAAAAALRGENETTATELPPVANSAAMPAEARERPRWPWRWDAQWRLQAVAVALLVNLTTHPAVTVLWLYALPEAATRAEELARFYAIEAGVVLVEGLLFWLALPLRLRHAMMLALIANAVSAALSPVLWS